METENRTQSNTALLLDSQLCFPLYACAREVVKRYRPFLDGIGLTYTQYIAMMVLWETPCISSRYINRKRDEKDERNLILTLTEAGEALKERAALIPPQMSACIRMDPQDAIQLYTLLHRLLDTMCEED